ncbi:tripartite tricarboxylate transporter TctB family protein [Nocardia sp. NBC_00508]|uniref:tripartite tricarboxylate transporter TctB family protein n=1 Tax=Nocardia sp. NBC_00508 TaxID=2975992 RepID=UPI002E7FF248|nr:tripartite tricarboxylate transporter TctB family protein [Nocardia sp. NBC_00508]WUD66725.1 tripartite tricarboxylate transporter TctB family protein [Nocardia sp. NBC_00508]
MTSDGPERSHARIGISGPKGSDAEINKQRQGSNTVGSLSGWLREHAELGVVVLLAGSGALVIIDAMTMPVGYTQRGPVGPKAMPLAVGALLLVVAVTLAVDVLRGGRGEAEAGEDIDLATPPEWRTVLLLVGVFVGNIVLIDIVGFPISGALLFWGAAYALGSRHWLRDPLVAVALALVTYVVFVRLLDVPLPGGPLDGMI